MVISPATTTSPVVTSVSQATRLLGSFARAASRIVSEIWSAILSGCPSVTDSEVKRCVVFDPASISSPIADLDTVLSAMLPLPLLTYLHSYGVQDRPGHLLLGRAGHKILPGPAHDVDLVLLRAEARAC